MADYQIKASVETLVLHHLSVYEVTDDVVAQIRRDSEKFGLEIEQLLKVMGDARWAKKGAYCTFQYIKRCFFLVFYISFERMLHLRRCVFDRNLVSMSVHLGSQENGSIVLQ